MNSKVRKIWEGFTTFLVVMVVILAILLAGVRLFGLRPLSVLSGSMEPVYHVGSVIYVRDVDYTKLSEGDIITFMVDEDTLATHRIIEVVPEEEDPTVIRFRTKGDANDAEDGSLVHYKNIVGTPVFTIPELGYIANFIQNPPGTYIAIAVGALFLMLFFIPDLFSDEEEESEKREKKKERKAKKEQTAKNSK